MADPFPNQARRYHALDRRLLAATPTARKITLPVAEIGQLLGLPTPVSAYQLEQSCTKTEARRHWQRLGFAVHIDWLTQTVVFSRLLPAPERERRDR